MISEEQNTNPTINAPLPEDRPGELIFQLGKLQVFWFPTGEEVVGNVMPHHTYWRDNSQNHFGPFPNTYQAVKHYAYLADMQKNGYIDMKKVQAKLDRPPCPIVFVDFRTGKKVTYELPGEEVTKTATTPEDPGPISG